MQQNTYEPAAPHVGVAWAGITIPGANQAGSVANSREKSEAWKDQWQAALGEDIQSTTAPTHFLITYAAMALEKQHLGHSK